MKIAVIGAGNLGIPLALKLAESGNSVVLQSRDTTKLAQVIDSFQLAMPTSIQTRELGGSLAEYQLVLLTVPDTEIAQLAAKISPLISSGSIIAHCSGALDSSILRGHRSANNELWYCSLHPLNTFPSPYAGWSTLAASSHATALICEGDSEAITKIDPVFSAAGFNCRQIGREAKPLYHAASVMVCNYLAVLMHAGLKTAEAAGLNHAAFWQAVQPLLSATLNNIGTEGAVAALSGPLVRGDSETVSRHLSALEQAAPELTQLYKLLGLRGLSMVNERGELADDKLKALTSLLGDGLDVTQE